MIFLKHHLNTRLFLRVWIPLSCTEQAEYGKARIYPAALSCLSQYCMEEKFRKSWNIRVSEQQSIFGYSQLFFLLDLLFGTNPSATMGQIQGSQPGIPSSPFVPWPKGFSPFHNPLYYINPKFPSLHRVKFPNLEKKLFFW